MKIHFILVWYFLLPVLAVHGQNVREDSLEFKLPTDVIITAPRIILPLRQLPFSVSMIDAASLSDLPRSISIDESMKLVPGVKVDNEANGNRVHVSIRGQGILTERGIRGIKMMLDGIPLNDPTGFAPDLFDIDYAIIDHIEVLRGPTASLYGSGGAGGIINITTQNGQNRPIAGEASFDAGSNNFWKVFGKADGEYGDLNYMISVSRTMGDGYREQAHFRGNNLYAKATYKPAEFLQLTPIIGWSKYYNENPEGITLNEYRLNPLQANPDAIPYNEFIGNNRMTLGLTGLAVLSEKQEIQFSGYAKKTLFTEANNRTFAHRTITTPGLSVQYIVRTIDSDTSWCNLFSIGTDLQWQSVDEHRVENLFGIEGDSILSKENIHQRGTGIFAIDKFDIGKYWSIMGCLRYDNIRNELSDLLEQPHTVSGSANFSKATSRIGVTYSPDQDVTLYASWGQGFLPPSTEELAQNPDNFGGFNKHLLSATSSGYELGSRGILLRNLHYEITCFTLTTENDFNRYRISDSLRTQETFYQNAGASRRYGLEISAEFAPLSSLSLKASYTYSHFVYANSTAMRIMMDDSVIQKYIVSGNFLPNSPRHQLALDFHWNISPAFSIGLTSETLSKSYIDGANIESEAVEGYTVLHCALRYKVFFSGVNYELTFSIRNMTDIKYVAFSEPDPEGYSYQAGPRREFFGILRIRF